MAKSTNDLIKELAQSLVGTFNSVKPFEKSYGSLNEYLTAQLPLTQQGVAEQTNKYFLPQIGEGIASLRTELASRGLFRSGIRGKRETGFLTDIADQEAQQREQLLTQRAAELRDRYAKVQSDYEKASQQGSKFAAPTSFKRVFSQPIVTNPTFSASAGFVKDPYSPVSAYQGTGTSKYGPAYQKWFEEKFKQKRPDVNYNI